jgi:hypothetical protein
MQRSIAKSKRPSKLDFKGSAAGKPTSPEGKLTKEGRPRWIKKGPEAEAAIN